jgi:MSHA pilin protein MshD
MIARRMHARHAFTMAEAVVSSLIVSVALVAALTAVGASKRGLRVTSDRARGAIMAQQLMSEILELPYVDPQSSAGPLGLELGETRSTADDIDDYNGLDNSPPARKDGTPLADATGWRRTASVNWVNPSLLTQIGLADTGMKIITVCVYRDVTLVAKITALRSRAWKDPAAIAAAP